MPLALSLCCTVLKFADSKVLLAHLPRGHVLLVLLLVLTGIKELFVPVRTASSFRIALLTGAMEKQIFEFSAAGQTGLCNSLMCYGSSHRMCSSRACHASSCCVCLNDTNRCK